MDKLLVVGADTVVGANLALALTERFEVVGLSAGGSLTLEGVTVIATDLTDPQALKSQVKECAPRWILHCGGLSASAWDLDGVRSAVEHEPHNVKLLADLAEAGDSRLTVVSSDAVFAGPRMFHEENSPATAALPAAVHARNLEGILQSTSALVVRTHAFGFSPQQDQACLAERMWDALRSGAPVAADPCHHATPMLATDLAPLLVRAYERKLEGLYHITGAERTSPTRFAAELAAAADIPQPRIRALNAEQCSEAIADTSLNSRRARRALDVPMPMLREGLARFVEQAAGGWRDRLHAAAGSGKRRRVAAAAA